MDTWLFCTTPAIPRIMKKSYPAVSYLHHARPTRGAVLANVRYCSYNVVWQVPSEDAKRSDGETQVGNFSPVGPQALGPQAGCASVAPNPALHSYCTRDT